MITTIERSRLTVALLGAGTMGSGMAERMLEVGFPVNVWDRTQRSVVALTEHGATVRAKPTEAVATAEIVVTMLANADAVADVMLRGGTLDALRANATWAQMGTIGVEATERLAAEVARRRPDVMFVDAPVSGSREPARTGRLLVLGFAVLASLRLGTGEQLGYLGPLGLQPRSRLVMVHPVLLVSR